MFKDNTFSNLATQINESLEADKARNQEIAADNEILLENHFSVGIEIFLLLKRDSSALLMRQSV